MTRLIALVESWFFARLMALPPALVRRLAGRPIVRDGQTLDPETQWMLRVQRLARDPGLTGTTVEEVRRATRRQTRIAGGHQPIGAVSELEVPGGDGPVRARLYVPHAVVASADPAPLLFFMHGGGMVFGDLDSHDATCRLLAERASIRVLAVDYRLAPEHPFPAGIDDCWAALRWTVEHAAELGADPARIAVGGDSAGGTLAAVMAMRAAEAGVPLRFQLLVYPATDLSRPSESRRMFADGFYLDSAFVELATSSYVSGHDPADPLISVTNTAQVPDGLAPALVVTAGFDPLRDEGEAFARLLAEAGVTVELKRYPGLIHGFLNVVGVGRATRAAVVEIAAKLQQGLRAPAATGSGEDTAA